MGQIKSTELVGVPEIDPIGCRIEETEQDKCDGQDRQAPGYLFPTIEHEELILYGRLFHYYLVFYLSI